MNRSRRDHSLLGSTLEFLPASRVTDGTTVVKLRPAQYSLLQALFAMDGLVLTKRMSLVALYGNPNLCRDLKIVDVLFCQLRRALRPLSCGGWVRSAWGRGYYWAEVEVGLLKEARAVICIKERILLNQAVQAAECAALRISPAELEEWREAYRLRGRDGLKAGRV